VIDRAAAPLRGALVVMLLAAACGPTSSTRPAVAPPGPPTVDPRAVERHARQFDHELATRPAGSQREEIAAGYLLGHLQQAGYGAFLDGVPVADLVRSTNVIAVPPRGGPPSVVVAVPYDTAPGDGAGGEQLGLFLEVARALRVADDNHSIEFAALGAEHATLSGGHLGTRRLTQLLREEHEDPLVIVIGRLSRAAPLGAEGPGAARLAFESTVTNPPRKTIAADAGSAAAIRILADAGFTAAVVGGDPMDVGRALLEFLADQDG
jgi:hypothetical protein